MCVLLIKERSSTNSEYFSYLQSAIIQDVYRTYLLSEKCDGYSLAGAGTFSFPCVEKEGEIDICTVTHNMLSYIIPAIAATGLGTHVLNCF